MRSVALAQAVAEAEALRLRALAARMARRAAFAAVAIFFAVAAIALLHVAAVVALFDHVTALQAVLVVAAADIVVALCLALLAARHAPGATEREALALRQAAWQGLRQQFTLASLIAMLFHLMRRKS